MNPKEILQRIERQAMKKGISMAELCRHAGLAYSTYWRWTKGEGMQVHKLMILQQAIDKL